MLAAPYCRSVRQVSQIVLRRISPIGVSHLNEFSLSVSGRSAIFDNFLRCASWRSLRTSGRILHEFCCLKEVPKCKDKIKAYSGT